jgi:N-acetylneuraminic acid mutarotase
MPRQTLAILLVGLLAVLPLVAVAQGDSELEEGWTELAPMPVPRSEFAAVAYENKIYTLGGFGAGYTDYASPETFEAYNIETDEWETLPDFPDTGRHHHMMAEYDGKLYVFGGTSINPVQNNDTSPVYVFDFEAGEWSTAASMPTRRVAGVAVVLDDAIYIVGGTGFGQRNNEMLRYLPETDEWETLEQQPIVRDHVAGAVLDGKIWAIGGRQIGREDYDSVSIYDPQTSEWTVGPPLNVGRAGFGAVVVDGKIYVTGGELLAGCVEFPCLDGGVESSIEMYDPDVGEWEIVGHTPVALHGLPIVAVNDNIYVTGGSTIPGGIANPGQTFVWER